MKPTINIFTILFLASIGYSQQNLDTIYGNPKYLKEKVEFLNIKKQNYIFMEGDGDYGHATIFTPKIIKDRFYRFWYNEANCFYINYEKKIFKNGKAKNETWYNKDGSIEEKYEYTYDKNLNQINIKSYYYDNEFWLQNNYYDKANRLVASVKNYSEEANEFNHWYFDRDVNGNIIKSTRIDEDGYSGSTSTHREYNDKNKLTRVFRYIPNKWRDSDNSSRTFIRDSVEIWRNIKNLEYDKNENLILELSYNEDNKASRKTTYKYDNSNLIERTSYSKLKDTSLYSKSIFRYNEQNLKVKEERIYSGKKEKLISTTYDDNNYIVQIIIELKNKTYKIDYKYVFDKKGNWTKIIKIVNEEPLYVWTRKIKYY